MDNKVLSHQAANANEQKAAPRAANIADDSKGTNTKWYQTNWFNIGVTLIGVLAVGVGLWTTFV